MKTAKNGRFIEPINDRIGDPVYLIRQQAGQIPSAAFRCCLGVGNVFELIPLRVTANTLLKSKTKARTEKEEWRWRMG